MSTDTNIRLSTDALRSPGNSGPPSPCNDELQVLVDRIRWGRRRRRYLEGSVPKQSLFRVR